MLRKCHLKTHADDERLDVYFILKVNLAFCKSSAHVYSLRSVRLVMFKALDVFLVTM